MGLDKLIKREISITIATVLLVTTVFIMFSYAIFKVEVSGEQNVITFGDVAMQFCKDTTCNSTISNIGNVIGTKTENGITRYVPIYPQNDPTTTEEWNQLTPYTFTLSNKGSLDLYISIYLAKTNEENYNFEHADIDDPNQDLSSFTKPVDDDQIKIALGEKDSTPTIKLFSEFETTTELEKETKKIASNILIPAGETKVFNLYAWLKSDAANASQGKYFVTQISARGEYLPEDAPITE